MENYQDLELNKYLYRQDPILENFDGEAGSDTDPDAGGLGADLEYIGGQVLSVGLGGDIQAALDTVAAAGGGQVNLKAGTYFLFADINIPAKVSLVGAGTGVTILDFGDQAYSLQSVGGDSGRTLSVTNFSIRNLTVQNSTDTLGGIVIRDCGFFQIENVSSESNSGDGFYISACFNYSVEGCFTDTNTGSGFRFHTENFGNSDNADYNVINCASEGNGVAGFRVSTSLSSLHYSFSFIGCSATGNTGDGFSLEDYSNIIEGSIVNCTGANNTWHFDIAASRLAIIGCSAGNGGNLIRTDAGCSGVAIIGCNPSGDFNIQGDSTVVGVNIENTSLDIPFERFDSIVDTIVPVTGTGSGSTTTERSVRRMFNTSGGSLAVGDIVVYKSATDGDEITTTTTAGDSKVFGMMLTTSANNTYDYVLTEGYTKVLKVNGTTDIAVGDYLSTFTTAKIAKKASAGETVFAIALEAYTTDDSSGVIDAYILPWRFTLKADAASDTTAGTVELATAAETTTGTDATRAVTPDGLAGSDYGKRVVGIQVVDAATNTATGDGKAFFRIPSVMNGWNLVGVAMNVYTAGTTNTTDVQIRNVTQVVDMLTTKLTIDSTETDTSTAATAAVIDTGNDDVATGDKIAIDVDAVHTTPAKGLFVELQFQLP